MGTLVLFFIAIGLSFDSFAVSITCGILSPNTRFFQAVRIAIFFAVFQAFMPIIGWLLGLTVRDYIAAFDHWVAFGLLAAIGIKMIIESFKDAEQKCFNPHKLKTILLLSLATTIDAFAVGISFAFWEVNILLAAAIIGMVTFIAVMLGILFGKKIGEKYGQKMEIIGGIILIGIGLKILLGDLIA